MFDKIKYMLNGLIAIFNLLIELIRVLNNYKKSIFLIAILVLMYFFLYWFSFIYPKVKTIDAYYSFLDNRKESGIQSAWNMLNIKYREGRWNSNFQLFKLDYKTTEEHEINSVHLISINESFSPISIARGLFASSLKYEISLVATNRFTKEDCLSEALSDSCKWVQLKNPNDYNNLINGTLQKRDSESAPSILIDFTYKKHFHIKRESLFRWVINAIDTTEQGIILTNAL